MNKQQKVLFLGDSITAAHRDYSKYDMGDGYVNIINNHINKKVEYQLFNRGRNGARIIDLYDYFENDFQSINPDILTIEIGINDLWNRQLEGSYYSAEKFWLRFEDNYKQLLELINQKNLSQLIIIKPFALPKEKFTEDIKLAGEIINTCIDDNDSIKIIDLMPIILNIQNNNIVKQYFERDGIHPTQKGHEVIAKEWLSVFSSHFC